MVQVIAQLGFPRIQEIFHFLPLLTITLGKISFKVFSALLLWLSTKATASCLEHHVCLLLSHTLKLFEEEIGALLEGQAVIASLFDLSSLLLDSCVYNSRLGWLVELVLAACLLSEFAGGGHNFLGLLIELAEEAVPCLRDGLHIDLTFVVQSHQYLIELLGPDEREHHHFREDVH